MNLEELKQHALTLLETSKKQLLKNGNIIPVIALYDAMDGQGATVMAVGEPHLMNNEKAKDALADTVNKAIAEHGFTAVIMISDTWTLKLQKHEVEKAMLLRRQLGIDNVGLAKMGYGKLTEQLTATVEMSNGDGMIICQPYTRKGDKVTAFAEREDIDAPMKAGRFKWFDKPRENTPIREMF